MVGFRFDDIDRQFRKPAIKLECKHCASTESDVIRRVHWHNLNVTAVLCVRCWHLWCPSPTD